MNHITLCLSCKNSRSASFSTIR